MSEKSFIIPQKVKKIYMNYQIFNNTDETISTNQLDNLLDTVLNYDTTYCLACSVQKEPIELKLNGFKFKINLLSKQITVVESK